MVGELLPEMREPSVIGFWITGALALGVGGVYKPPNFCGIDEIPFWLLNRLRFSFFSFAGLCMGSLKQLF